MRLTAQSGLVLNCARQSLNRPLFNGKTMYTIGQVAKKFSISRSTLLYYDSIGLLSPSGRSNANYRLYSPADLAQMEKISQYRSAGLSLAAITNILHDLGDEIGSALESRLFAINQEIQALRRQQKIILQILENKQAISDARIVTKEIWVSLLSAAGLDEAGMQKWHCEFEKTAPEAHQDFLESLGIDAEEIESIRCWSREGN